MTVPTRPVICLRLAAALVAGLAAAFLALALAVATDNAALAAIDARLGETLGRLAAAPIGAVLAWLSALHGPRGIVVLTALAAAGLWRWRDRAGAIVLLLSVLGGATINHALKHGIQRPRPGLAQAAAAATDFSFPSGHAANATLLYGTLAALLMLHIASRPARVGVVAAAALMLVGIACSRVMLGAHRASDVAAGVLVGMIWLTACLALRCAVSRAGRPPEGHGSGD